jgi:hypothetical protein
MGKDEMKKGAVTCFIIGFLFASFGYWGMFTKSGQKNFDEMDGMYPFFGLLTGIVFFLVTGLLVLMDFIRKKSSKRKTDLP